MATSTKVRSSAGAEREHHRTNLWAQVARFIGLYLSPILGLLVAWLIHVWVMGVDIHWRSIDVERHTPAAAPFVAVTLVTAATIGISVMGFKMIEHRKPVLRWSLAGSIATVGTLFGINLGAGPTYWWGPLFIFGCWTVAAVWSIARLDVARNDKTTEEPKEDGFLEKIGLKGWNVRKATPITDDKGNRTATEVEFQHAEGDTVDQLQEAVPNLESKTASPRGLSRAVGSERADRSTATILHVDPLKDVPVLPPLSAPGGSITDPLLTGIYSSGAPVYAHIGGNAKTNPSSYMFMGMTRAGKTTTENQMLTESGSRRDVVILYGNKAKGMQDVRSIIPVTEAVIITDEADSKGLYRHTMKQIKKIMTYRQQQLGLFGVEAWTKECFSSPPWRTDASGRRVQMEPMPFLICHFGEADAILADDRGEASYIASKGLSLGITSGWSLQRADHTKMDTGLRFNIGTRWCFGCGDSDSAEFALSDRTIKAGAHPDYWKANKPGYFFLEGPGIDDEMFPVHARGFGQDEHGNKIANELLRRNLESSSRVAKLDAGSVAATEGWWEKTVEETASLRSQLLEGGAPQTVNPQVAVTADVDDDDDEVAEATAEMEEEVRNTTHVEGVELYPQDGGASAADATADLGKPADGQELSWEPSRPEPRDRNAAVAEMRRVLIELSEDESLRDPGDPTGHTVIISAGLISERYGFRSRPWFSEMLDDMGQGRLEIRHDLVLSPAPDLGATRGKYRLRRVPDGHVE